MSWFKSSEHETRWSTQVEEFEHDIDEAYDLARETIRELDRLKGCTGKLRNPLCQPGLRHPPPDN